MAQQRDGRDGLAADVVVVGAGPVGLWLAAELRLAGVDVLVLDKRVERSSHSRALTVHARTLEVFAMRGLADQWLAEGIEVPSTHYALLSSRLDLTGLDSDFPFALSIPQRRTEELIEEHATSLGATIVRDVEVVAVTHHDRSKHPVTLSCRDGHTGMDFEVRCGVAAGCDGRQSIIRREAGISFTGTGDTLTCTLGDVQIHDQTLPAALSVNTERGAGYIVRIGPQRSRVIAIEHATMNVPREVPATFEELRGSIERIFGSDYGMHDPTWVTRVGSATFQADDYRSGPLFLAGDAAHVHFPMGGQGMNLGIQDAMNLGWKLGAVINETARASLLDTYHEERWHVGSKVVDDTLSQTALVLVQGREGVALRKTMADALAGSPELNAALAAFASGLTVAYPADPGAHRLVGERVPNLSLVDGSRLFDHMTTGKTIALGRGVPTELSLTGGSRGVAVLDLLRRETGEVTGSPWTRLEGVLIRPDGYVQWAKDVD